MMIMNFKVRLAVSLAGFCQFWIYAVATPFLLLGEPNPPRSLQDDSQTAKSPFTRLPTTQNRRLFLSSVSILMIDRFNTSCIDVRGIRPATRAATGNVFCTGVPVARLDKAC
ncbi:hypothetical protein QBC47DRAFT_380202 [Echria macrotheca]|uniref:Uncharacterized protein n=1 Tax=Echria macrotheca TaxID=438768 RepID=A0AAJ0BE20_9PEZI|nr:hypothetical protein QBC47DRAFT_380202 [Echria macrotheca]